MKMYLIALFVRWLIRQHPEGYLFVRDGTRMEMSLPGAMSRPISVIRSFISGSRQDGNPTP